MTDAPFIIRMPAATGLKGFGVLLAVALTVAGGGVAAITQDNPGLMISSLVPLLVGYGIAWILTQAAIEVVVSDSSAQFSFRPIWRRTVDGADISEVRLHERVSPTRFGGVGYRRVPGRVTALLWQTAPGVEITTVDGDHIVVATTQAAQLHQRLLAIERQQHGRGH